MNYQYFEKPLITGNNKPAYCPYTKVKNSVNYQPQPQTLNGKHLNEICVPNLSDRMYIPGYGLNICNNNKPIHLNFNEKSECFSDNMCQNKLNTCYDPLMGS